MSIAALQHLTLVGMAAEREQVLEELQDFGCLEIIALRETDDTDARSARGDDVSEALQFLLECQDRRRQFMQSDAFDPLAVQRDALQIKRQLLALRDEQDELVFRRTQLLPWGEFEFPPIESLDKLQLWFYRVPHHLVREFEAIAEPWEIVKRDHSFCYIIVVSETEPEDIPVARDRVGNRSLREIELRLQQVEVELEHTEEQRAELTHWCTLLAANMAHLEDHAARAQAAMQTLVEGPVFGLQGWLLADRAEELKRWALQRGLACLLRDPLPDEQPPTALENSPVSQHGEALVTFYMTPAYRSWDPSPQVLFSFAVFFAMIIADAGYALVLALVMVLLRGRLRGSEPGRWLRTVGEICVLSAFVYGVLIGSWFGVSPPPGHWLAVPVLLDVSDSTTMITLTIAIGVLHLSYASLRSARVDGIGSRALAALGWAVLFPSAAALAGAEIFDWPDVELPAALLCAGAAAMVVGFSGAGLPPLKRAMQGLLALTRVTAAFGDTLSYLRLFALGLASASLAQAFNQMAGGMESAVPGMGLLLSILVLLLGHGLNIVLGLASAVIHGLRLNVIEFFNWGLGQEGRLMRPFRRKETE